MIEIGRLCVKTAGRDAGLKCIIVDILDDKFVLIDGETRRRKCNILHLEPLKDVIKIKKNASHD
jgi:large subunit ribosomal protein L14e